MRITPSAPSFVRQTAALIGCISALVALPACGDESDDADDPTSMSFFVTSTPHDGNLGGLAGADKICQDLAAAAGSGSKTWKAYLSAANNGSPQHAKDRIGTGPWYNAKNVLVAQNLTALHGLTGNADLFITEKGDKVNGQWNGSNGMNGTPVNEHDIMTGSNSAGELLISTDAMTATTTCNDWTTNTMTPGPQVGHTDGMGPGMDVTQTRYTSWNGGHAAAGCSSADLAARGGSGRFYCFAL